MKMVPVSDFTDVEWYHAYHIVYDRETNEVMGTNPSLYVSPPPIVTFYETATQRVAQGVLQAWLFYSVKDIPIGYVLLDKTKGEWELGIAIKDTDERSKGYGARAALRALKWAFEEEHARWVVAFTQGKDLKVPQMVKRMGFEKLYHFWVMTPEVWDATWAGRIK